MGGKETLPHLMIQDAIVCLFLLLGSALMLVASIRLTRLPDPLTRIVHSGFLFRRVPEISVLIRVGESATFGAYHVWREHRECRLAFVA